MSYFFKICTIFFSPIVSVWWFCPFGVGLKGAKMSQVKRNTTGGKPERKTLRGTQRESCLRKEGRPALAHTSMLVLTNSALNRLKFLASPRYATLAYPNCRFTIWNGCSTSQWTEEKMPKLQHSCSIWDLLLVKINVKKRPHCITVINGLLQTSI